MKKTVVLIFVVSVLMMLTGCFTTVSVNSLAPSEINLGANQVIAVSPTENRVYSRTSFIPVYADEGVPVPDSLKKIKSNENINVNKDISNYISQVFYQSLSEGVYDVISPEITYSYIKSTGLAQSQSDVLKSRGITLLLNSTLDYADFNEWLEGKAVQTNDGKVFYRYYLCQKINIGWSYRLLDVETGRNVDALTFSKEYPGFSMVDRTLIAQTDTEGKLVFVEGWELKTEAIYKSMIDSIREQIRDRLVPHVVKLNFGLMESRDFSDINKLVNQGYLNIALDQYLDIYEKTGNIIAGYNSSVLYYGLGNPEEAISFAEKIYKSTLNSDIGKLLTKMKKAYVADRTAKEQAGL